MGQMIAVARPLEAQTALGLSLSGKREGESRRRTSANAHPQPQTQAVMVALAAGSNARVLSAVAQGGLRTSTAVVPARFALDSRGPRFAFLPHCLWALMLSAQSSPGYGEACAFSTRSRPPTAASLCCIAVLRPRELQAGLLVTATCCSPA